MVSLVVEQVSSCLFCPVEPLKCILQFCTTIQERLVLWFSELLLLWSSLLKQHTAGRAKCLFFLWLLFKRKIMFYSHFVRSRVDISLSKSQAEAGILAVLSRASEPQQEMNLRFLHCSAASPKSIALSWAGFPWDPSFLNAAYGATALNRDIAMEAGSRKLAGFRLLMKSLFNSIISSLQSTK